MHLLTLGGEVVCNQLPWKDLRGHLAVFKGRDGLTPCGGQMRARRIIGVAMGGRGGGEFALNPCECRTKNTGHQEIGVHITPCDPMFDPPRGRRARGNPQRGCAVFITPCQSSRGMGAWHKSIIAAGMGGEDQHRPCHPFQTPRNGMVQRL